MTSKPNLPTFDDLRLSPAIGHGEPEADSETEADKEFNRVIQDALKKAGRKIWLDSIPPQNILNFLEWLESDEVEAVQDDQ